MRFVCFHYELFVLCAYFFRRKMKHSRTTKAGEFQTKLNFSLLGMGIYFFYLFIENPLLAGNIPQFDFRPASELSIFLHGTFACMTFCNCVEEIAVKLLLPKNKATQPLGDFNSQLFDRCCKKKTVQPLRSLMTRIIFLSIWIN